MVLRGGFKGYTTPLNAPLYTEPPWLYRGVRVLVVVAGFDRGSVEPLLPETLEVLGDPVVGAVWLANYPFSTLGPYNEALVALQVADGSGVPGYYIPYIYVDSDAALAAGREVLGAPKKHANIRLEHRASSVIGRAERAGATIIEASLRLEARASEEVLRGLLPEKTVLYGLRVLPGIGGPTTAQLVQWYVRVWFDHGPSGVDAWSGKPLLRLASSVEDPLGELRVRELMGGFYAVLDMELGVEKTVHEWRY